MTFFKVSDLGINFGGIKAVDGVNFELQKGEVFSIIGPNGAGKTTTFNLISRIYDASSGNIEFMGEDITRTAPHKIAGRGIARTFQNIELFEHATVLQNLLVGRHTHRESNIFTEGFFLSSTREKELRHREKVEDVIEFLDLQHYRDVHIMSLPFGVRKVVELGRALCVEPKLLLLDEPSTGLNLEETDDMSFWIEDIKNELGITVLMIEHDMGLVSKVSDRVLAMNFGKVLALGTSKEVQENDEVIKAYLGG